MPVFGFGAKPKWPNYNSNQVSHCFPLNLNFEDPFVFKTQGVMEAYCNAVPYL